MTKATASATGEPAHETNDAISDESGVQRISDAEAATRWDEWLTGLSPEWREVMDAP